MPILITLLSHCRSWFHCQKGFRTALSKSMPAPRSRKTRPNWEKCEVDMASQVTEAHSPLKTQSTTRRHLLCLAKEQAETTACFLDSLLISGDNFSHLCPGGNIFEWTLSGVRVSMCICGVHVCTCWCPVMCRCVSGGVRTWRCQKLTSGVFLSQPSPHLSR